MGASEGLPRPRRALRTPGLRLRYPPPALASTATRCLIRSWGAPAAPTRLLGTLTGAGAQLLLGPDLHRAAGPGTSAPGIKWLDGYQGQPWRVLLKGKVGGGAGGGEAIAELLLKCSGAAKHAGRWGLPPLAHSPRRKRGAQDKVAPRLEVGHWGAGRKAGRARARRAAAVPCLSSCARQAQSKGAAGAC